MELGSMATKVTAHGPAVEAMERPLVEDNNVQVLSESESGVENAGSMRSSLRRKPQKLENVWHNIGTVGQASHEQDVGLNTDQEMLLKDTMRANEELIRTNERRKANAKEDCERLDELCRHNAELKGELREAESQLQQQQQTNEVLRRARDLYRDKLGESQDITRIMILKYERLTRQFQHTKEAVAVMAAARTKTAYDYDHPKETKQEDQLD